MEDEQMARVTEPDVEDSYDEEEERWIDAESERHWDGAEEDEELPPRPRSRFLAPLPVALIAVLIAAAGFLAGVLVQKGSGEEASGGSVPGASGEIPSFLSGSGGEGAGEGAGGEAPGGLPTGAAGGSGNAVTGTVTGVKGRTIYVKESEGNTVAVKAEDGSSVSRDSNVGVKKIHPGDSVVVQGSKHGSTVKASSISATEAGVESSAGGGFPSVAGSEGGGGSVESLFE